jgi:uncharacterized membrane protein YcaP (DUF421 family)
MEESIRITDWKRLLFGNAPVEFVLEALIRTIIMYLLLLIVLRLLGKRMNAQVTITELAVMISLGAIVALPMESPDNGILVGGLLLLLILVFQRGINYWLFYHPEAEPIIQGEVSVLIQEGIIQIDEMSKTGISKEQLFAYLREKGLDHLGQVERLYQEECGVFSLYSFDSEQPGLSILPEKDIEILKVQKKQENKDKKACAVCGVVVEPSLKNCPVCKHEDWTNAVGGADV